MGPGINNFSVQQQPLPSLVSRAWFLQRTNISRSNDQRSSNDQSLFDGVCVYRTGMSLNLSLRELSLEETKLKLIFCGLSLI